ncbi:MAG: immunoglobulin-like domain-containing protein, partial [Flavobacteriaceae bacterium]
MAILLSVFGVSSYTHAQNDAPEIFLAGPEDISIDQGQTYTEPGYNAFDFNGVDISNNVIVFYEWGNVGDPINVPGIYAITYDVSDANGAAQQKTRTLTVKDTEDPIITISGANPATVNQGAVYNDPGATATDNGSSIGPVVASPTNLDTSNAGPATITYTISDAEGNSATATRTVNILDTTPPEITLLGANPLEINQGTTYNEPGATVTDNVDGNSLTAVISGNVDTSVPGTYTRSYDAVDTAGNTAIQVTRTVTVKDTEAPVITVTPPNPDTVSQGAVYSDPGATATDNGSSIGPVVASPTNLDTSNAGPATI